ncbi:unnamed protein product [Paramecium sonneborni]|uniref:HTH myb-type domain-containing protein n=1 Tax=Paramecium sonneborni TaxID=65129 RepID=A0A8S1JUJ8_9CILI|nr:unnamed protein product [Paramecium sonneborni]
MQQTKSYDEISQARYQEEIGDTSNENLPILIHLDDPLPSQTDFLDLFLQTLPKTKKKIARRKKCDFHTKKRKKVNKKKLIFEKHTPFTIEEDEKILNLVIEHGPRFQIISQFFLDRSQNAVKNRYYKFLRYNWDLILGDHYQHLNYINEDENAQHQINQDLTNFLESMNFYPEVTNIIRNFITQVDNHFR